MYRNIRAISEENRLKYPKFAGHVTRMDVDRMTKRVWNTTREGRRETCVVELRNDWTEMTITVVGGRPTNMVLLNEREGYRNSIEKHHWEGDRKEGE